MSRFVNDTTGIVVSVDDSKDERYTAGLTGWSPAEGDGKAKKAPAKKAAAAESDGK